MSDFFDEVAQEESGHPNRRVWLVLLMFAALLLVGYLAAVRQASGRVPYGVEVAGVHIGGMSVADAETKLRREFSEVPGKRITLTHDDREFQLVPAEAGYSFDAAATVRAAGARERRTSPGAVWTFFTGGRFTDPRVQVDEAKFTHALDVLTRDIGRPVREGSLRFTATGFHRVAGRAGVDVDAPKVRSLVRRVMFDPTSTRAELPVTVREPYVDAADVSRAIRTLGRPAMSGPVTFTLAGRKVVAWPRDFGPALSTIPNSGRLVLRVDGDLLLERLEPRMRDFGDKPRNARVRIVADRPRVTRSVIGVSYDVQEFQAHFRKAVLAAGKHRRFDLHAAVKRPQVTTAQLNALGITEKVVSFGVAAGSDNLTALAEATRLLDGALIRPGRTLDLDKLLGPLVRERGLDTLAGAVFNAFYSGGYAVDDHTGAGKRDPRFPVGRDVAFGREAGLSVTDDSDHGIYVQARLEGDRLTVTLWSTRDRRATVRAGKPRCLPDTGYEVTLVRVVRPEGAAPRRERLDASYPENVCPLPQSDEQD